MTRLTTAEELYDQLGAVPGAEVLLVADDAVYGTEGLAGLRLAANSLYESVWGADEEGQAPAPAPRGHLQPVLHPALPPRRDARAAGTTGPRAARGHVGRGRGQDQAPGARRVTPPREGRAEGSGQGRARRPRPPDRTRRTGSHDGR